MTKLFFSLLAFITIFPQLLFSASNPANSACEANLRVIAGAMEMYLMDHPGEMTKLDLLELVHRKYLRNLPKCPDSGQYTGFNSKINCSIHLPSGMGEEKTCFANSRVLTGAVEMWNMDYSKPESQIGNLTPEAIQSLVKERYLKREPKCPTNGIYSGKNLNDPDSAEMVECSNHGSPDKKFCMANLRVLLGASEMFNMDNESSPMKDLNIEKLVNDGYLKNAPRCFSAGQYKNLGDLSTAQGTVTCTRHGGLPQ